MNISKLITVLKTCIGDVNHEIFIDAVDNNPNKRKVNIVFRNGIPKEDWIIDLKNDLRQTFSKEVYPSIVIKKSLSRNSTKEYFRIVMTMNIV